MTVTSLHDIHQEMASLGGHMIGFFDSLAKCNAITQTLIDAGYPESSIMVLSGPDGIDLLKRSMSGTNSGEAFEQAVKQGIEELEQGNFAMMFDAEDCDQAIILSNVATSCGGRGCGYFEFPEKLQ